MVDTRPKIKRYEFNIMYMLWLLLAFSVVILVFDNVKRIFDQNSEFAATYISSIGVACSVMGIIILYMPACKTRHTSICGGFIIIYILLGLATFVGDCVLLFAYFIPWLKDQREMLTYHFDSTVTRGELNRNAPGCKCILPHPLHYSIFISIAMTIALTVCDIGQMILALLVAISGSIECCCFPGPLPDDAQGVRMIQQADNQAAAPEAV